MPQDDDDLDQPLSNRRALERADHGKSERQEEKRKKDLRLLRLDLLKKNVHVPLADEESGKKDGKKKETDARTKTREEQAKQATETAQMRSTSETMIETAKREEAVKAQTTYEKANDQTV